MSAIYAYLTFDGNCRQAMTSYKACLGGKLVFQSLGQSPGSSQTPEKMKRCILHASLVRDGLVQMGTDLIREEGFIKGNAVSLLFICSGALELKRIFLHLSRGGRRIQPPQPSSLGDAIAHLVDTYGNHWML